MKAKRIFFFSSLFFVSTVIHSQSGNWKASPSDHKAIIENKGQFSVKASEGFDTDVKFAIDTENEDIYFTPSGVVFRYQDIEKGQKTEEEKIERGQRKRQPFATREEFLKFELEGRKMKILRDQIEGQWIGANENVEIIGSDVNPYYHNYAVRDLANTPATTLNEIKSYRKITYKNLYPNIDAVYEIHPLSGIKYSLILHPGADLSVVKLKYSKGVTLGTDGKIRINTRFGEFIDHEPLTFYQGNQKKKITSAYEVKDGIISFRLAKYDNTKTVVIDPWSQSPTFNTDWDCVWECERDGSGNVYIIGGVMPLQLIKYNSTGTIQWTYNTPYDTTSWLGTFAVDNAGNSYVTQGSVAAIQRVSTAGALVWDNPNPGGAFSTSEFWNIAFNCDQTKLVVGGTGGFIEPYIYDIDMATGNILSDVKVHESVLFNDQEVRSIVACDNATYYYLTHDSIGYVHESLQTCSTSDGTPFHVTNDINFGYKCENFRYNNTGIMALAEYDNFIFVHRGNQLQKRDFQTAAVVATVAIPGGVFTSSFGSNYVGCSGIDIDDCGNIYVGSTNGVYKFDQNLGSLGSFATTFNVYDVEVNSGGEVIAAGSTGNSGNNTRSGFIQSFAASACVPQTTTCCDASFCDPGILCTTNAAFNFETFNPGGTWSASCGTCINSSTGLFDPNAAGAGSFTITYTVSCGSESMIVNVYNCTPLDVCIESNGDFTVSGGVPTYNWTEYLPAGTSPITTQAECSACDPNYTWLLNSCMDGFTFVADCNTAAGYYYLGTGTTITPGTNFPIQVTDAAGQTFTINDPSDLLPCTGCPALTVTTSNQVNVNCNGQSTGSFDASTSGGTGPYDYTLLLGPTTIATFNDIAGTQSFTGLAAGTYTINVVDNNGCPGTATITITQNPAITVSQTSITQATCGSNNGSVTVSASGGSGSFTYSWNTSPVQTGATASNLAAGSYTVTATDGVGCTATLSVTITSSGGPTVSITNPQNPSCNNGTDGEATASVSGGTGTMDYVWSPAGGTAATATGLSGGVTYTVTVTDDNGCIGTVTVTLNNPTAISITTSSTDANCGAFDGSLTASANGGTGTLSYSWSTSPVQNTATATGVPSGTYTVTVTDANGCTATATESVNNIGAPVITLDSQTDVSCNAGTDGTATVSATGGTGTLTYSWNTNPAQTGTTASNLSAGTYIVTVTDGLGCSSTLNVTITEPNAITGTITVTAANCAASDGSAIVVATGGDGSYTYLWSNSGTTSTISGLAPGTYSVTITDGNGCTGTASALVGTVSTANIDAGPDVTITTGETTTLTATGGVSYTWSPPDGLSCTNCASPDANPTVTTTYIITGTDANGCIGSDTVTVFVELPCGELWVPTAFSPNMDGNNEELCVYGGCIKSLTFQIFDRWGEIVFETTTNNFCWDGTYKGKAMNSAVFAYYLIATLDNGDIVELNGNISLVR